MPDSILAVFADVHANQEAFRAVLADMDELEISRRFCLGDIVGYAANPAQCLTLVRSLGCPVVKGNHDEATATELALDEMRDVARSGIEFARRKLTMEQSAYLAELPLTFADESCQFVHASLNEPGDWRYVLREPEARGHFDAQDRPLCFCGHTHMPMVWHLHRSGEVEARRGVGRICWSAGGKTLINVGSVGQPRDLNPAACYAICDPESRWVEFRRVEYEIQKTKRKIRRANLPRFAAQRLSLGRQREPKGVVTLRLSEMPRLLPSLSLRGKSGGFAAEHRGLRFG
jgi:diadenosine tetraphosphatase ApaH/serine/threonine PP2A family protein phosphatase